MAHVFFFKFYYFNIRHLIKVFLEYIEQAPCVNNTGLIHKNSQISILV